ncbi:conserved hypothetical protein [Methanothermus fervidus DSM 2088]|uniref:DUF2111 domain-containing protein n=1 Tax=Methanothermus fervidus (strain ATCC 43054 / DSM 2088 / JCM 10308 / V24 S) TaxID=523846 RepID=E3GWC2_METFV|nr:DUF2111 domain-containing protein [Methanothermus fervidus]ADP77887.1 conserved hypothetical protein [Methanothermus fervidus DSM 2088]
MKITNSSDAEELENLALAIHELVNRLPLTMRSKEKRGLRIENGKVIDYNYTGPVLEKVLKTGKICKETPNEGPYKGIPVVVVPLKENGEVIAAIGVVDITKGVYSDVVEISRRPKL